MPTTDAHFDSFIGQYPKWVKRMKCPHCKKEQLYTNQDPLCVACDELLGWEDDGKITNPHYQPPETPNE